MNASLNDGASSVCHLLNCLHTAVILLYSVVTSSINVDARVRILSVRTSIKPVFSRVSYLFSVHLEHPYSVSVHHRSTFRRYVVFSRPMFSFDAEHVVVF